MATSAVFDGLVREVLVSETSTLTVDAFVREVVTDTDATVYFDGTLREVLNKSPAFLFLDGFVKESLVADRALLSSKVTSQYKAKGDVTFAEITAYISTLITAQLKIKDLVSFNFPINSRVTAQFKVNSNNFNVEVTRVGSMFLVFYSVPGQT